MDEEEVGAPSSGEYERGEDGELRWPAPDRDSAKLGEFSGTFKPERELSALLQMEGKQGRLDDVVKANTGIDISRVRRWHKIYERMGIFYPGDGNTRLARMGRFLQDATDPNGLERVVAREALGTLRRYQFDNPVERSLPPGDAVHPYWAILRAASELDWKLHWDELNRELMRITKDEQLPEVVARIATARQAQGYESFIGASSNAAGLLRARAHPAQASAPPGKTAEGQLRDQKMTPFMRRAGFGGLFLSPPGSGGGGYWTVPAHLRDVVAEAVRVVPEAKTFSTEQQWIDWFCEGTIAPTAESPPPPPAVSTSVSKLTVSKLREALDNYEQDLVFSDSLLANLVAALRSGAGRNFIILRGVSGTGKTSLVSAVAKAVYGASAVDTPELTMVEVRPDWTDGSYLFGHYDPVGQRYIRERFLEALLAAANSAQDGEDHPVFICLDEMNLARVEYYLADVLSAMESGSKIPLDVRDDPTLPSAVSWPRNVYLFGTVNIDETTLRISDKVLDRAQVIDTSDIDLLPVLDQWLTGAANLDSAERTRAKDVLSGVWTILRSMNAQFGYRTAKSIVRFLDEAKASSEGHLPIDEALDIQLVQKVLVKLRGEGDRWAAPLAALEPLLNSLSGRRQAFASLQAMRSDLERMGSFQFWN